jgi:hypothetical protein
MTARVLLYWLPLDAGGRSVRWNGRVFEAVAARHSHRAAKGLYHSALEVTVGTDRFVIEMTPVWSDHDVDRGVVQEGPVGARWLGRSALFRYEVRRWPDGRIPDVAEAVGGPRCVGEDPLRAQALLDLVPQVPVLTGVATSGAPVTCGTPTRSPRGCSPAAGTTCTASCRPPAVAPPPGWTVGLALSRLP